MHGGGENLHSRGEELHGGGKTTTRKRRGNARRWRRTARRWRGQHVGVEVLHVLSRLRTAEARNCTAVSRLCTAKARTAARGTRSAICTCWLLLGYRQLAYGRGARERGGCETRCGGSARRELPSAAPTPRRRRTHLAQNRPASPDSQSRPMREPLSTRPLVSLYAVPEHRSRGPEADRVAERPHRAQPQNWPRFYFVRELLVVRCRSTTAFLLLLTLFEILERFSFSCLYWLIFGPFSN